MIKIDYTLEEISGEQGPNIYFMGKPYDYVKLTKSLHDLGEKSNITIYLSDLKYINILDDFSIICKSTENGNTLSKIEGKQITIELTPTIWRTILIQMFAISFYPCMDYLDFDGAGLVEEANIMISSEF